MNFRTSTSVTGILHTRCDSFRRMDLDVAYEGAHYIRNAVVVIAYAPGEKKNAMLCQLCVEFPRTWFAIWVTRQRRRYGNARNM